MVWRLKVGAQWVWVYVLLEFQSEPDPWMALRMLVYVGLLSQHLVREGELHEGLLPPNDILEADAMLEQTIGRWFDEATMKGVLQGKQEGRQEGFAKAVALQLQLRFGTVPEWAQERLSSATEEQLIGWTGAILRATSLAELFGTDGSVH